MFIRQVGRWVGHGLILGILFAIPALIIPKVDPFGVVGVTFVVYVGYSAVRYMYGRVSFWIELHRRSRNPRISRDMNQPYKKV